MIKPRSIFLLTVFLLAGCTPKVDNLVCFKDYCVTVEIAQEPTERLRGLQQREFLGDDQGMLFIFPENGRHSFWMKDTKIPLDIIWLDYTYRVVHMVENVPPCVKDPCPSYFPDKKALYVLELNAGEAAKLGVQKGDRISLRLKKYLFDFGSK